LKYFLFDGKSIREEVRSRKKYGQRQRCRGGLLKKTGLCRAGPYQPPSLEGGYKIDLPGSGPGQAAIF
jgi:hypothetical protein